MAETERTGLLRRILGGQSERTEPGLGGYGYNNAEGNRVGALRDMFDGGGRGQSGARFEGGGMFSAAANAVARPSGSRDRGEPDMRTGVGGFARDMIDGGGFGQSGPTFQGGMYGGLLGSILNRAGVRPMGYQERLGSVRPQMRPPMPTSPAAAAYTAPAQSTLATQPDYADRFTAPAVDYANAGALQLVLLTRSGDADATAELERRQYAMSGEPLPEGAQSFADFYNPDPDTFSYMRENFSPETVRAAYEGYLRDFSR
tara:strand:- start:239 stop:1015 length:777 start_codon:yes stop_codon:yes gene_type:complete